MKIVFFGTPDYVLPILNALWKYHKIVAVVTQPPKPVGRNKFMSYTPVDDWGYKRKVKIIRDISEKLPEAELGVVAAYGQIIPQSVIGHFKYGILNIHPSLLPKYRGASPIQEAIKQGDSVTGVTIIKMDKEVDHGPIVSYFKEDILPTDTNESLRTRLFERSAEFLIELIPNYISGKVVPKEQDHKKATYTKLIKREDGYIDLKKAKGAEAERFVRAMSPWPGAWTFVKVGKTQKRLKILNSDMVQLEGKNPVTWKQFESAYLSSQSS